VNLKRILTTVIYSSSLGFLSLSMYMFWRFHQALAFKTDNIYLVIGMDICLIAISSFCAVIVYMNGRKKKVIHRNEDSTVVRREEVVEKESVKENVLVSN